MHMDNEKNNTDIPYGDTEAAPQTTEGRSRKKKALPPGTLKAEILSWIQILLTAACIAFVLNTFIIANSKVPSGSMENTIMTDDRVIGSRLTYLFSDPNRGDIIIFHFPDNPPDTKPVYYVKRVIGLPGETVDIINGQVYINGSETPLEEPYLKEKMGSEPAMHFEVPEGCYFMMGDNRNHSYDARYWENTFVKKEKIIAKVMVRYWPLNKIGRVR